MGGCTAHLRHEADHVVVVDGNDDQVTQPGPVSLPEEFFFVPMENRIVNFRDEFDEEKELGSGATGSVWSMTQKSTGQLCAVKKMKRSKGSNTRQFTREANILLKVNHNHIVTLVGVYVDRTNYYIAQEYCTGGMVLDRVKRAALSEQEAIDITYQILDAVKFLHDHNIVHRDIKPDNIMYQSERTNRIVLVDFGQAREIRDSDEFSDYVGTPAYMAPEMTRTRTGAELKKVDVWAVGVTVFVLVTRHLPFFGENVRKLFVEICQKRLTFPRDCETPLLARKFIATLLRRNVACRPSAGEAMEHPWIESDRARTSNHILKAWADNISSYRHSSKLKQFAVDLAIGRMDEATKSILDAAFSMIDVNNDGSIQEEEYAEFMKNRRMTTQRVDIIVKNRMITMSNGGEVTKQDFERATWMVEVGNEKEMRQLFEILDVNGDGQISVEEIQAVSKSELNVSVEDEDAAEWIAQVDRNGDGVITFREFQDAMRHLTIRKDPTIDE